MYFRFQRRFNLLTIDDTFAHLVRVLPTGDMKFEFRYTVSQREAVQREALTVNVSVFSRTIQRKSLLGDNHLGSIDNRKLVGNVLTQMPDAKSSIKQQEKFTVVSRNSDITAQINNAVVGQLAAGGTKNTIRALSSTQLKFVPASEIKQGNDPKPVLVRSKPTSVTDVDGFAASVLETDTQKLMHDMISRQGLDPTHIFNLSHRSMSSVDTVGGILNPKKSLEFDNSPSTQLLHWYLFNPAVPIIPVTSDNVEDDTLVHILVNEPDENVEVPVSVVIPSSAFSSEGRDVAHFFVKFDMIDSKTGTAIDSVTKPLDVARHVQLFNTPRIPPIVKAARAEQRGKVNLEIKQVDPGATSVRILKKTLYRATTDIDKYTLIGTYDVKSIDQSLLVPVDLPRSSSVMYRVVPVGAQGTVGFEFTNVVVKPARFAAIKSIALTVQQTDLGVKVELRKIPKRVVAVEIRVRNLSVYQQAYSNVGGGILLIDDATRISDHLTVIDNSVAPNNIYEYAVRLIYRGGEVELAGNSVLEYLLPESGKVDTTVENVTVDNSGTSPNVTCNITTKLVESNVDIIKKLLENQGIIDQFKDNLQAERAFFSSFVAHNVQRVDLSTGTREDFGVLTDVFFSDVDKQITHAVSPLQYGHRYRYEVQAMLRAPETMFDAYVKTTVDKSTQKSYNFSPAKFLHPIALTNGTLMSKEGLKTRYAKDPMSHGLIGDVQSFEVSFDGQPARIVDQLASEFDRYLNIVTWKLNGSIDEVDHFVVMTEVHGTRRLVGKVHSGFPNGNCQYLHPLTPQDVGQLTYVITPVFKDYKTGDAAYTNSVIIEAP